MRRTLLAVSVLAGVLLASPGGAWVDPCLHFVGDMQALNGKIAGVQNQLDNLPDIPKNDVKRAQLQALLATYKQNLGILQNQYAQCEANNPPPSPPPSVDPFVPATGAPDPQLAVSTGWVVTVDTSNVVFYPRHSDGSINFKNAIGMSSKDLFQDLITTMNQDSGELDSPIRCLRNEGLGCIRDAYDTRVFYDSKRNRFWIAAALRPHLWKCDPDNPDDPDPDNLTGYFTQAPDPSVVQTCHAGHGDEVHRYIAVAVTKYGDDPDFYSWVLVDEYADWPQMTVAKNWLILNHRGEDSEEVSDVRFFFADDFAQGLQNGTILQIPSHVFHADDFNVDAYDWTNDKNVGVTLDTAIYLTTVHGASDGVEFLVAGYQNYLIVYGFKAPNGSPNGRPVMLHPAAVNLGDNRFVYDANNPPVWRNGRLYYAYETCANDHCHDNPRIFVRLLKVPVHHAAGGNHGVYASSDPQKGYLEATLGNSSGDHLWYSRPVVEVNRNDDLVMVFSRTGLGADTTQYPSVRYSILYHDRNRFSQSQPVADGELLPVDQNNKPRLPWGGGVIDLGGAGLDPLVPGQVWLSHAYANAAKAAYIAVITAVVP